MQAFVVYIEKGSRTLITDRDFNFQYAWLINNCAPDAKLQRGRLRKGSVSHTVTII